MTDTHNSDKLHGHQLECCGEILNNIADAVIATNTAGNITFLNSAAERLIGWKSAQLLGTELDQALNNFIATDLLASENIIKHVVHGGHTLNYPNHWPLSTADGEEIVVAAKIIPMTGACATSVGAVLILQDVSCGKLAEHSLNINQKNLSLLIKHAPVAIAIFDQNMCYLATSQRWMTDYNLHRQVLGLSHYEVFPEISEHWREIHRRALRGEIIINDEDHFQRLDGSHQWLRWEVGPWYDETGAIGGIMMLTKDITDRKNAEEDAVVSRLTLNAALASMSDAVLISDTSGKFVEFNEAFATFHRFNNKAECAKNLAEYPTILEVFMANGEAAPLDQWAVPRALRGEIMAGVEYIIRRKDTGESWIGNYSFAPIRNGAGLIIGSVVTGRDVTEQRQIENALRASEQRLAGMVNTATDAIITIDEHQLICLFNPAAEQIFGISIAEALGQPITRLMPESFRQIHADYVRNFAATGTSSRLKVPTAKVIGLRASGEEFPIEASISQIELPEGKLYTVILRDITERELSAQAQKSAEQRINEQRMQLEEAQRHQIARQTAAAIAHELNQPLTAIASYTAVALQLLAVGGYEESTLIYALENAERQAHRAGQVMHELLSLLHKDESIIEPCNIEQIVDDTISIFVANAEFDQIKLVRRINPGLLLVLANRLQIQKVLVNLIGNALQAMQDIVQQNPQIILTVAPMPANEAMLQVSISDTGKGFADQDAQLLFQPFYTTKATGLGMGLAICRAIIEAHTGKLWAEPNPGQGASFHFTLPFVS
ncbi:PAS domain S-box protein [Methylomonas paludis]|uniref:histidine kinase n=1 Tax=Methylomonas paludis TaxID=1173101 RepID=A0A975MN73_9GAMM|nr:PAS domain-containing sensor histidine kinase [Methylomonas paludis]QWF70963.1 PAS domain S-box protein [Methylomonas paludis]